MARTPAFFADCLRASPLHSVMKTQKAKSKIVHWHKKLVMIIFPFNVCVCATFGDWPSTQLQFSSGQRLQNGLKYDVPDWFWCMCEFQLRQVMWPQNSVIYLSPFQFRGCCGYHPFYRYKPLGYRSPSQGNLYRMGGVQVFFEAIFSKEWWEPRAKKTGDQIKNTPL